MIGTLHRGLRVTTVTTLALFLVACGFQLRGSYRLPEALFPLHIDAPAGSAIALELRDDLRRADAALTDDPSGAAAQLVVVGENRERRILSVGSSAKIDEYEVRSTVRWKLVDPNGEDAAPLLGETELEARRDYRFDPTSVLAKQQEEEALYEQMSRELAQRILFRLQAWSPADG